MKKIFNLNFLYPIFIFAILIFIFLPTSKVEAAAQCTSNTSEATVTSQETRNIEFGNLSACQTFCPSGPSACTATGRCAYTLSTSVSFANCAAYCSTGYDTASGGYCVPSGAASCNSPSGLTTKVCTDSSPCATGEGTGWCQDTYQCTGITVAGKVSNITGSCQSNSCVCSNNPTATLCQYQSSGGTANTPAYLCGGGGGTPPTGVDIKATIWNDGGRSVIFGSQTGDGPLWAYSQAPYRITWGAVTNASSCTINNSYNLTASEITNGGNINNLTMSLGIINLPLTLICTSPTGETSSDTVVINLPPPPTNSSGSCPAPGNLGSFSWTASTQSVGGVSTWNTFYTRLYQLPAWTALTSSPAWDDNFVGTAKSNFPTTAGIDYYWSVHSKLTFAPWSWGDPLGASFTCQAAASCIGSGTGTGLLGKYYDQVTLTTFKSSRVDGVINFDPADFLGINYVAGSGDNFSIRWEGQIQPRCSENYTFYTRTDDGTRLWINNNLVINKWINQAPTEWTSSPITLTAGTKYDIKMEYYELGGGATAQLYWSSPSTPKAIIPQAQLYPTCTSLTFRPSTSGFSTGTTGPTAGSLTVSAGSTFYAYTDYGQVTDAIVAPNVSGSYSCVWETYLGTVARFRCTAPSSSGNYIYTTGTYNIPSPGSNICASGPVDVGSTGGGIITVSVPPVTVNISATSNNIPYNTATNISWSSTNATSCSISPTGWSGLSGNQSTGNLTTSRTYTISCNPTGPNSSATVLVNVQAQATFGLTVIKSGQGTVVSVPPGINCGVGCPFQSANFIAGTSVVLTATPSSGRIFTGWSGGSCSGRGTCTVNNAVTIYANFAIDPNYKEF